MFVESIKLPNKVEVLGFEYLDKNACMIEWLRKGGDCQEFITLDLESELYAQDQGAQLLFVHLNSQPSFETRVRKDESGKQAIVTHFSVTFPISLRVKASNGVVWLLDVKHNYQAENMDVPERFQLRLNFTIVESHAES